MKTFLLLVPALFSLSVAAESFYLKPEDQPHFKNDSNGRNDLERIDETVKEMNRMWTEINALKREVKSLKEELAAMEAAKKAQ